MAYYDDARGMTSDLTSHVRGKMVHFGNTAWEEMQDHMIKSGARVHVYYNGTGDTQVVERVVVDED